MIRFGTHCSLRKGLVGSLDEADRIGCEAIQIFTRSPRMWRMKPPAREDAAAFRDRRRELGIHPLVVHTPYLPNLATSDPVLYRRSRDCLAQDLAVSGDLEADYLVIHPGSFSVDSDLEGGIVRIDGALNSVLDEAGSAGSTMILLENVAGGGRRVGGSFEELRRMIDGVDRRERIGVCLDTAHAFAAGYDLATRRGIDDMLDGFGRIVGLDFLKVIHFNDSMAPFASRKDRHEHLGEGHIGQAGFKYFVERVKETVVAGILETPKDAPDADRRNLELLLRWRDAKPR